MPSPVDPPRVLFVLLSLFALCAAGCRAAANDGSAGVGRESPTPSTAAPVDTEATPAVATASVPDAPAAAAATQAPAATEAPVANPAPEFTLADPDGARHSLADYRGKWVVLEWTNHGCPYVKKHYDSKNMQGLQARYTAKGVAWLTICSSAPGKEGNQTPQEWKQTLLKKGAASTATLLDPDGTIGHAYGAKTTPHMFVIDPRGSIVYRGAIDDKKSARVADVAAHCYVAEVLDAVMDGKPAPIAETPPYG